MREQCEWEQDREEGTNYTTKLPTMHSILSEYVGCCVELSAPHPKGRLGLSLSDCTLPWNTTEALERLGQVCVPLKQEVCLHSPRQLCWSRR